MHRIRCKQREEEKKRNDDKERSKKGGNAKARSSTTEEENLISGSTTDLSSFLGEVRKEVIKLLLVILPIPPHYWSQLAGSSKNESSVKYSNGVLYCNIRGLLPQSNKIKISYLRDLVALSNPLCILLKIK